MGRRAEKIVPHVELAGLPDRLRQLIDKKDKSDRAFARRVGLSPSGLNGILSGNKPGVDALLSIARNTDCTLDWLATGREAAPAPSDTEDVVMVPQLDIRPSAGPGRMVSSDLGPFGAEVAFSATWLRHLGVRPDSAHLLIAIGDSMEPTIRDGDMLLVNRAITRVETLGIYVVTVGGMVVVKRAFVTSAGVLILKSDNSIYPEERIEPDALENVTIEGRVRWSGRSM